MRSPPLANEKKDRHRATKPGANELLPIFLGGFWRGQSQKKQHSDTKNLRFTQEKMVHAQIFAPVHIPSKHYQQLPAPSADRLIKDASQFLEMIKTNPQLMTTWTADAGAFFRFKPHKKYTDPGPGRLLMFLVANRPNQKFELLAVNQDHTRCTH